MAWQGAGGVCKSATQKLEVRSPRPVRGVRRCSPRASWVGEASSLARAGSAGARMETAPPPAAWRCSATKRRRRPRAWRRQRANSSWPGARCAWRPMRAGGGVWCGRPRVASGPLGSRLSAGKHSIDRSGISSSEPPAASGRVPCKAARPSRTRGARGGRTKESTLESHPAAAPLAEEACEDADGASSTACRSAAARSSTLGKSIGVGRRSVDQRRAMCRTSSACSACSGASPPRESKSCCVRGVATRREPARRFGLRSKYACVVVERPGVGRSCGTEVGIVARLEHARRVDRGHRDGKARGREWCHARLNEVEEVLEPHQARPSEIGRWIVTLKAEQAPPR